MEQEWFDQILQWHVKCHNPSAIFFYLYENEDDFLFLVYLNKKEKKRKEESSSLKAHAYNDIVKQQDDVKREHKC